MNAPAPMSQAEFDQCCGQCLAGVALDHYGAMESVALDRVCENCPLISASAESIEKALSEARAQ
ncbi:hypothetical protein XI06_15250 [Bradyrhizobium sp. CCBAU 11434]|uniref:hypothetical protein n=1 Tax=Bradyrhizobium sp. CCBAU 11434 TaxID=1630885 RepID=UPI002304E952|nr:hypothetical protein [Bradyrhizobium sp. CCBAU 11434]MDA9521660.1 hypothetical protein [Bradyrhizobium sp. CCBAU 11434]